VLHRQLHPHHAGASKKLKARIMKIVAQWNPASDLCDSQPLFGEEKRERSDCQLPGLGDLISCLTGARAKSGKEWFVSIERMAGSPPTRARVGRQKVEQMRLRSPFLCAGVTGAFNFAKRTGAKDLTPSRNFAPCGQAVLVGQAFFIQGAALQPVRIFSMGWHDRAGIPQKMGQELENVVIALPMGTWFRCRSYSGPSARQGSESNGRGGWIS